MEQALKLIISKSQNAAGHAMQVLQAIRTNSPVTQLRYNQAVQIALNDPNAYWEPEERALLASHLGTGDMDSRDFMLRVRLTETERLALQDAADAAGENMSDYVRGRLFDGS